MTARESIAALEAALAAGPDEWNNDIQGPSKPTLDAHEGGDYALMDGGTNVLIETFYRVNYGPSGTRNARANALLIAAANPAAIRSVLARVRELEAALQSLTELEADGKHADESSVEVWERARAALKVEA